MDEYYAHIRIAPDTGLEITQTVQEHCFACAKYAEDALAGIGLGCVGRLSGLMHDGKMTHAYQEYLRAAAHGEPVRRGSVNHTFAPVRYLLKRYHTANEEPPEMLTAELIAYAIGAHHGLFDCTSVNGENGFDHRLESDNALCEEHMDNFLRLIMSSNEIDFLFHQAVEEIRTVGERIPGLANDIERDFAFGALARLLLSAVIEGDRRDTAIFMHGGVAPPEHPVDWKKCMQALDDYLSELKLGPLSDVRNFISDECCRMGASASRRFRLHVSTGAGKTLSALRFALSQCLHGNNKRILFVMPLLAIIDQNAKVIRAALGDTVDLLEHHSNVIIPKEDGDELDARELLCESWHAPVICTTLVQFLDTLFAGRTSCIRRFQALCESVIILDEAQSVPIHMLSQFNLMINFLTEVCGATVVLCSATQAVEAPLPHPILPAIDMVRCSPEQRASLRRTEILLPSYDPMTADEIAEWCKAQLAEVDTLLVIGNTRAEAADLFSRLKSLALPCVHLSASMCMAHRRQVLAWIEALPPGEKLVCVATQVIEAGVDASFQRVGRFMAGLDDVVQAAGRCNRHGENLGQLGRVQILMLKGERLPSALQTIKVRQTAAAIVMSRFRKEPDRFNRQIDSEAAIQAYYQELFRGLKTDGMDYPLLHPRTTMLDLLSQNSYTTEENGPRYYLHQAFREAGARFRVFSEDTIDLVVPYGEGAELLERLRSAELGLDVIRTEGLMRALRPFTISVYRTQLLALENAYAIETLQAETLGILALRAPYYDPMLGLKIHA